MKSVIYRILNKFDLFFRLLYIKVNLKNADLILMGTSAQSNLGDHAISIAEVMWFKKNMPNKNLLELPKELFYKKRDYIKKRIRDNQVIVITGGGFLGDLWMTEEEMVRSIISDYKNNKIVIMPQTIFFEDEQEKKKTLEIYNSASNLIINTRDERSYNYIKKEWNKENVHLVPDMVLTIKFHAKLKRKKDNILLCIRNDKENCLDEGVLKNIKNLLGNKNHTFVLTSTVEKHIVPIFLRDYALKRKLKEFSSAKLVVTNRLHAMIFAYLTGTPCLAIDNLSKKVSGVYHWISNVQYIKLIEDDKNIENDIEQLISMSEAKYYPEELDDYFIELINQF